MIKWLNRQTVESLRYKLFLSLTISNIAI